jgi:putative oxidoreductase
MSSVNAVSASPVSGPLASFAPWTHTLLRVGAGLLFMQHGVQKLFGLLADPSRPWTGPPPEFSQMWFAGVLETFGGLLIVLGLFTRPVAFILAGEMAVAYFQAHAPRGFWPLRNGGEPTVLYSLVFLYLFATGAGPFSLDAVLRRRRESGGLPLHNTLERRVPG